MDRVRGRPLWGWLAPAIVAVLALALRLRELSNPAYLMFDETYYAKDAWSLLNYGYSRDAVEDANDRITAGDLSNLFTDDPTWIVHPDGGKWMIAAGQALFGMDPVGWRISAVIVGVLTAFVLARLVLRLTDSIAMASVAAYLWAIDGVALVMSRIALLDIFLTFWIVSMVAALAADQDWLRRRLPDRVGWFRPWQLIAGVCAGLAVSTKWSALWVVAAFGITIVCWELAARGWPQRLGAGLLVLARVGLPAFGWLVVVGALVYLATWSSWLVHHEVFEARFGHGYGDVPPWGAHLDRTDGGWWTAITDPLLSLWRFHQMTFDFHTGDYLADKTHPYQAHPLGWLVQARPTSVDTVTDVAASECGAASDSQCISEVLILGNPAVWWASTAALVVALGAWLRRRTWRWSLPLVGVAATWLPWFFVGSRPIFTFYAVVILPFLLVAFTLVIAGIRRRIAEQPVAFWIAFGSFLVAATVLSWWFWPLWTNELMPYREWYARMWFRSWI